jgi:putative transposase
LWQEVKPLLKLTQGVLVIDDSTLDKPYASQMALVSRHWSGKHQAVVQGINLISLVWTDRECRLPCATLQQERMSKNDHFQHMIAQAARI